MLKEFLESLSKMAVQAAAPTKLDYGDPRQVLLTKNGTTTEVILPAPLRAHTVTHIDDFITAVNRWGVVEQKAKGVVFHSEEQVVLVVNDDDRRDVVRMDLVESDTFTFLRGLNERGSADHKTFVRILRTILFGKVPDGLLPVVRKLEAATATKVQSEIQVGRERGTREFAAELIGTSELPEQIQVATSIYSNAGLRVAHPVRCTLDVELPSLMFRLQPLPDELEYAIEAAQQFIHEKLLGGVEDGIDVFHGSP